jgi:protease-4
MKRFLVTFAAVVAAQIFLTGVGLFGMVIFTAALMGRAARTAQVPDHAYLVQEIPTELLEYDPPQRLPIGRPLTTHTMILENLARARFDDRIEGVILKIELPDLGWGKMEEIRQRIHELREAGKPVYAYAPFAFNRTLYLASACDSIFVPPEGLVWFTGLMAERMYVKDMLEKVGVGVQISRIKEYKSVPEMYERTDMSPEVRANTTRVLSDLFEDIRSAVAQDRGVAFEQVDAWLEVGQFDPASAAEAGLIDGVLVWEELERRLSGPSATFASIEGCDYAGEPSLPLGRRGSKVAVVHGQGTIATGRSGWNFLFGLSMGEETMAEALDAAAEDAGIQGIVLRLDTPGGLGLASERIGQAVERAAAKKPLVVSTADINASGGYMVSYRCSTIVAPGNAIVGSIGSFAVRPNLGGLMNKLGIDWDRVTVGPHATLFSGMVPMTEEEFRRFEQVHRRSYDRWIAGVAHHRGMSVAQVDSLARGQIYTGRQALAAGLIDALGGLDIALDLLREQMGVAGDEPLTVVHYPVPRTIWEELRSFDMPAVAARVAAALHLGSPLARQVEDSIALWETLWRGEDGLLLCEWRF